MNKWSRSQFALSLFVATRVFAQDIPEGYQIVGTISGTFLVACPISKDGQLPSCQYIPQTKKVLAEKKADTHSGVDTEPSGTGPAATAAASLKTTGAADAFTKPDAFQLLSKSAQFDLAVPASPAFAVLGLSPEKIQRPGAARDFAASLVRGLGTDGKLVNGVAIDIAPASVFFRKHIIGGELYSNADETDFGRKNWGKRILARTTLSIGTTEGEKSGSSKIALGIRVGIWDEGDPGLYVAALDKCLKDAATPDSLGKKDVEDIKAPGVSICDPTKDLNLALWAKPALYAGFGKYWYSETGKVNGRSSGARSLWLTYSQGLISRDESGQVKDDGRRTLLQAYLAKRLDDRFTREDAPDELLSQNSVEAILRLRSGLPTWHAYVELGLRRAKILGTVNEKIRHFSVGAEFKVPLGDDAWIQLAQVREKGFFDGKVSNAVTGNIRFGSAFLSTPGPVK